MVLRRWWVACLPLFLFGCFFGNDPFLDPTIPRIVSPSEQIAFVRTKWLNYKLQQTTFLDKQNRILEDFVYGYSSQKTLHRYVQDRLVSTKNYYHSDSSPTGYLSILESELDYDQSGRGQFYHPVGPDTIGYEYDTQNRLVREVHRYTTDRRNKVEPDTTAIDKNRSSIAYDRKRFFDGNAYFPKNDKTDLIEYRYKSFDPAKHVPLHTSQNVGY